MSIISKIKNKYYHRKAIKKYAKKYTKKTGKPFIW